MITDSVLILRTYYIVSCWLIRKQNLKYTSNVITSHTTLVVKMLSNIIMIYFLGTFRLCYIWLNVAMHVLFPYYLFIKYIVQVYLIAFYGAVVPAFKEFNWLWPWSASGEFQLLILCLLLCIVWFNNTVLDELRLYVHVFPVSLPNEYQCILSVGGVEVASEVSEVGDEAGALTSTYTWVMSAVDLPTLPNTTGQAHYISSKTPSLIIQKTLDVHPMLIHTEST